MHLSYAIGTPTIAIFSSRGYPVKWYPSCSEFVLRKQNYLCVKCYNVCKDNNICLREITPAQVLEKIDLILTY